MFTGSEASRAMREIRSRDPAFDMNRFVQSVKLDAPHVVKAFLKHDLDALALHCGPELLERFAGIFKHFSEQVGAGGRGRGAAARKSACSVFGNPFGDRRNVTLRRGSFTSPMVGLSWRMDVQCN